MRREGLGQGEIVRVDVKDVRRRIEGWTAPLGSAIEAGHHHRIPINGNWNELAFAADVAELLKRPLVSSGSTVGESVLRDKLEGKGSGLRGKGLLDGCSLTG